MTGIMLKHAIKAVTAAWTSAFILGALPLIPTAYFQQFYSRSSVCLPMYLTVCNGSNVKINALTMIDNDDFLFVIRVRHFSLS